MVKFAIFGLGLALVTVAGDAQADEDIIMRQVTAEACDYRLADDDVHTAENRALDKASLLAVKSTNTVQEYYPNISEPALNLISYRIIDEYLFDATHEITSDSKERICVKMSAELEMTPDDLVELINEYKYSVSLSEAQVAEVAEEVKEQTQFKPQNLNEKKLLFIQPLHFWNDEETENYIPLLREQLSNSDYFLVTDDEKMTDYILTPEVEEAKVDIVDEKNRKMKMVLVLKINAINDVLFEPLEEQQNHFILFGAGKNEQLMADMLIRKLLARAAITAAHRLDKYIAHWLEEEKLRGQRPMPRKSVYLVK